MGYQEAFVGKPVPRPGQINALQCTALLPGVYCNLHMKSRLTSFACYHARLALNV